MKRHGAQRGSAHFAGMPQDRGEIDARGGGLCDDFARRGIAHRDATVPAALPGAAHIALQIHRSSPQNTPALRPAKDSDTRCAILRQLRR
jgi:hypothetical protein